MENGNRFLVICIAIGLGAGGAACGGSSPSRSSSLPLAPTPVPTSTPSQTARTVDVLSGDAISGVTIQSTAGTTVSSDTSGYFNLPPSSSHYQLMLTAPDFVTRETSMFALPTLTTVTLIPNSFDLRAFSEMFNRAVALHRWVQAPRLVIERSLLALTSVNDEAFQALSEQLSDGEVADLTNDLRHALPLMTADSFYDFSMTDVQTTAAGSLVIVKRAGAIVVARYQGLEAATTYWGYGRWAWNERDAVVSGIIFLDRDFDRSGSPYRHSLRLHEMGHALGYDHVTVRPSVMNATARVEPNQFDRETIAVAFKRSPGNQIPDRDPSWYSLNSATRSTTDRITWGAAVP